MKVMFVINISDLGFEEPLGVLYLSSACKSRGHEVFMVENSLESVLQEVEEKKPDILAYSVLSANFPYLFETHCEVRKHLNIRSVFGGPHATFFPEILEKPEIDYVFRGECENAFPLFLDKLNKNEPVKDVPNLGYKEEGKCFYNPLENLENELDIIRLPDRSLLETHLQFYNADVRSVIASRGCPYKCSYCFNNQYQEMYDKKGKKYRIRSVDNLIEECVELKEKYKTKMIHFFDDIFPPQKEWLKEFAEKYKEKVGLPYLTNTSFNVCTENYVKKLSESGCKCLLIGVETGNEKLREEVLYRKMNNDDMVVKAKMINRLGIKIYTQNLIGLPHGSLEHDIETLELNVKLRADYAGVYLCQPYPKTAIEKIAKEAGILKEEVSFGRSFYHSCNLVLEDQEKVEKLRVMFPVLVCIPFLAPYVRVFLKFPLFPFIVFGKILHGYKIKTCMLRYNMGILSFIRLIRLFFKRSINQISNL
ncbi:MAG: B12-binding domain-containing radical SAM protein [Nitrospinae bacterium]|nr:B12-binding domain-containing radical SAM protein [Nitrospinota bacterium]